MAGTRVCPSDGLSVNLPAIHVFDIPARKDVDGRDKRGHDG
jgi:hypothetical protein